MFSRWGTWQSANFCKQHNTCIPSPSGGKEQWMSQQIWFTEEILPWCLKYCQDMNNCITFVCVFFFLLRASIWVCVRIFFSYFDNFMCIYCKKGTNIKITFSNETWNLIWDVVLENPRHDWVWHAVSLINPLLHGRRLLVNSCMLGGDFYNLLWWRMNKKSLRVQTYNSSVASVTVFMCANLYVEHCVACAVNIFLFFVLKHIIPLRGKDERMCPIFSLSSTSRWIKTWEPKDWWKLSFAVMVRA